MSWRDCAAIFALASPAALASERCDRLASRRTTNAGGSSARRRDARSSRHAQKSETPSRCNRIRRSRPAEQGGGASAASGERGSTTALVAARWPMDHEPRGDVPRGERTVGRRGERWPLDRVGRGGLQSVSDAGDLIRCRGGGGSLGRGSHLRDTRQPMSEGSVELAYRANDAFRRRDLEAFLALIDSDAEVAPRGPEGGSYRGHEGVRTSWQEIFSVFADFGTEVDEVRDFGQVLLVAARGHGHGVGSDAPFEQRFWQVVELRDEKIVRWRSYRSESEAVEAMRGVHRAGRDDLAFRIARPGDAALIAGIVADAFEAYRVWAPSDWSPPGFGEEEELVLARALGRADVWCLLALADGEAVGHVALSPFTAVDPEPAARGDHQPLAAVRAPALAGTRRRSGSRRSGDRRGRATRLRANSVVDGKRRNPCPAVSTRSRVGG